MEFDGIKGWDKKGEHNWIHKDGCVATYNILEDVSHWKEYQYLENTGRLNPLTAYLPEKKAPIISDYKGKVLKAGESYFKFDRFYEALSPLGTFKIRELYLKEQPKPETITAFYYNDQWFIVAPIVNVKEDVAKGKLTVLEIK